MPRYTFKINELEYWTVDAFGFKDALERAGIAKDDPYELAEGDDFDEKCLTSAIVYEGLFGSRQARTCM